MSNPRVQALSKKIPADLIWILREVYERAGMRISNPAVCEPEGSEYSACQFGIDGRKVIFRVAKRTPNKIGQFVTIWKRPSTGGVIVPIDSNDGIDFVVIAAFDQTHYGQFVFSQELLLAQGVMSKNGCGGKRAIRVYPPWTKPTARQALKTQDWQLQNFFMIPHDGQLNLPLVRKLFSVG